MQPFCPNFTSSKSVTWLKKRERKFSLPLCAVIKTDQAAYWTKMSWFHPVSIASDGYHEIHHGSHLFPKAHSYSSGLWSPKGKNAAFVRVLNSLLSKTMGSEFTPPFLCGFCLQDTTKWATMCSPLKRTSPKSHLQGDRRESQAALPCSATEDY